ncbi:MAG: cell division protein FtsK [Aphanizomenon flos-aquae MDT14a]|jgi:S-DNA-T family DNA segregation ATPase FtsK/SpoIIIE|uniref:Cell division protein FtsK n=1 Tax=Aphanizomenon flos-aquae LD13 TaxID=1710894 RepID=A0A1B7W1D2_APHFL|nr:cell division protein FtsK [Aphanizomenon flos-aquae UKL13-PB]OBQ27089.1 MAG: cell division protein FtsK [Aphanizomenon flos-aquae LD13]OBQ27924.1 MAG: cell division protein FtsK [Aphanizomenon flos-aquae MDT14a]HCQ22152.1 cell division protein FtsK [Anabaena sp. UBA12330]
MHYLTEASEIYNQISQLSLSKTLWIDTEIADWYTDKPKLALIQVLADYTDLTGESAYIFDVLDKPDLAVYFINQIMVNSQIEKVFHNAGFDLKYLGKELAQNVTCTLKIARKITKEVLQTTNLKLKTLAAELCQFSHVDAEEGSSDWGKRPLTQKQLNYAAMDTVYLAAVHYRLLEISNPDVISRVFNMVDHKSENSSLTPTKVRLAFECPRLFYLNHHFNCKAIFSPKNTPGGVGNVFHKLADDFINLLLIEPRFKSLFNPSATQLNVDQITSEIQQLFYQIKFFPYLQNTIVQDGSKAPVLLQVWQGLQGLIKKFTELLVINRRYCSAETLISNTFISGERNLEHYFDLPNGTKQLIRGEFDCLVFNFELKRLCMVEFKTYQPVDLAAQLAQVSLYSYMLSKQKKTPIDSAVYCVLPEFKEYKYSWEQLENTVHQLIPHKLLQMQNWLSWESPNPNPPPMTTEPYLCEICPQQQKCQTFFDKVIEPPIKKPDPSINADKIGEDLVNTLQSFGIGVEYHGAAVSPAFIRVKLKPNSGVKVNSILKLSADLQVQLGLNYPPLIAPQAGYVSVDLPRQDRQIAKFEDFIQKQFLAPTAPVKIAIGVGIDGKLLEADLSDPNTCHFLVGGTTGSGKSEFLRSLLLSLIYRHSSQHLKIALVDPKRVTFPEFEQMSSLYAPVVKDSDRAVELMQELVAEMESRYQKFEKAKCADLTVYNQRSSPMLPRIVCIFDEYADFMAEKEVRNILEQSIKRLGAMARAAGIHLIISTQRPEASIVTPIIRTNLPGRVALSTKSEADSKIILGGTSTVAAYLIGKGDLVYQVGPHLQRLQSLLAQNIKLS